MRRLSLRSTLLTVLALNLFIPHQAASQSQDTTVLGGLDVVAIVGAGALFLGPHSLWEVDSVECVPCDPSEVPAFERWTIAPVRKVPDTISDFLLLGIGIASWVDMANEGAAGRAGIVSSAESFLISAGITEVLKKLAGRKRPYLYTPEGAPFAGSASAQESWPSGHSAAAASLAASYWLTRDRISSDAGNDAHAWALATGAVGVAALRVAAAKHFPSDVLSGLAIGILTAGLVHTVKF